VTNETRRWTPIEDKTLIDNYDNFKNMSNFEDHLSLLLNSAGAGDKTITDVINYFINDFY
jgi:hypothetical protein